MKTPSIAAILGMSYTDFVGFVNQWNVPPGSYSTVSSWKVFGNVEQQSHVLEIACTTGFSVRELALLSGCSGEGVDISAASIEMAVHNKETYAPQIPVEYATADGYAYVPKQAPTHVVVGAALKFFPDPKQMLERIVGLFSGEGIVLAAPFYAISEVPDRVVEQSQRVFGITPTTSTYKETMELYAPLEILHEDRKILMKETDQEITSYCTSTIERACRIRNITDTETQTTMFKRLYEIKQASNDLREHQAYSVLVLRYRPDTYPHRYVELF